MLEIRETISLWSSKMKIIKLIMILFGLVYGSNAYATLVTYFLDQSNTTINGNQDSVNWGSVTIDDTTTAGSITFTVTLSSLLLGLEGTSTNFGIDDFGFSTSTSGTPGTYVLPSNWGSGTSANEDGFGNFEFHVFTPSPGPINRQAPSLTFSFLANGLTPNDFAQNSTGTAGEGNVFFAMHVGGFDTALTGGSIGSAYFGGSSLKPPTPPSPAPEPEVLWLLGFGLLGMAKFKSKQFN